jgi:hypothetical protein
MLQPCRSWLIIDVSADHAASIIRNNNWQYDYLKRRQVKFCLVPTSKSSFIIRMNFVQGVIYDPNKRSDGVCLFGKTCEFL